MTIIHTYFILESAEFDMVLWCKRIVAAAYALKKQMKQNTIHFDQPSPYLLSAIDFCNFLFWNIEFDELDFFPSLNWIFLPAVACKIQVWNRLKIKFIKLDISSWRFATIKCSVLGYRILRYRRPRVPDHQVPNHATYSANVY